MRYLFGLGALACATLVSAHALAANPVSEAHACLSKPFSNNASFVACLAPVEKAGDRVFSNEVELARLSDDLNASTSKVVADIRAELSSGKRKRFDSRLNQEGFSFYEKCILFHKNNGSSDGLALARCGFDSELWTLHFLFDNYRKSWEATK